MPGGVGDALSLRAALAGGRDELRLSLNHYAFGAIGDWLYRHVAGIAPCADAPGFRRIRIAPHRCGSLTRARLRSPYGAVESAWRIEAGQFELAVGVPANASASARLPGAALAEVRESQRPRAEAETVSGARQDGGAVELYLGSGRYRFRHPWRPAPDRI